MKTSRIPLIVERPRTARGIAAALDRLLADAGFAPPGDDPLRDALVRIAARYGEIVTGCLNAAPALHLEAFAGLIGGRPRPVAAARAHLVFTAAPGPGRAAGAATVAVVVPMHTRVAAAGGGGEGGPVVFETLDDLPLVRAEGVRAVLADAGHRRTADLDAMLVPAGRADGDPLEGARPAAQALHLAQPAVFGAAGLREVRVQVEVEPQPGAPAPAALRWSVPTAEGGELPLAVESDTTAGLTRSGEVRLAPPPDWPRATVDGIASRWLTVRPAAGVSGMAGSRTPGSAMTSVQAAPGGTASASASSASPSPSFPTSTPAAPPSSVSFASASASPPSSSPTLPGTAASAATGAAVGPPAGDGDGDASSTDATATPAVPPAPAFRPPRLRAVGLAATAVVPPHPAAAACQDGIPLDVSKDFYPLGERPRFGSTFELTSPVLGEPGARVEVQVTMNNPRGAEAPPIPAVSREGRPTLAWEVSTADGFRPVTASDGTRSLTQDGALVFAVPPDVAETTIAGVRGPWLRARLVSGHYGNPATTSAATAPPPAPSVRTLAVQSSLQRGPLAPDHVVTEGALTRRRPDAGAPFDAFAVPDVDGLALYLALAPATGDALAAGSMLAWLVRPAPPRAPLAVGGTTEDDLADDDPALPRWQVHTAGGWRDATVRNDDSAGLTRAGIVRLTLPDAPAPWPGSLPDPPGRWRWLRIVWPVRAVPPAAVPIGLTLNAVAARHAESLRDEVLGSGTGRPGQAFQALRTPIVGDVWLQVREDPDPDAPWITWEETDDLGLSTSAARHYALDRTTGEIRFGDGRHGRMPPPGRGNMRLHVYATGGGARGNVPAGALTQLQSAVPAVAAVTNPAPAAGGLDADDPARLRANASAWLRHRDRAVTADDLADLARQASPEVARAFGLAGCDLSVPPGGAGGPRAPEPGVASVIVVPQGGATEPQPDRALLAAVKAFLDARRPPAGRLVVVGPTYARAAVTLRLAVQPGASPHAVAADCASRVARFLHPLAGGPRGRGWRPGERPHRSDVYALAGAVDGVDVVRALKLGIDDRDAAARGVPGIVAAGAIDVTTE